MSILKDIVGVIGSIILVYLCFRIAATVVDFFQHRYGTRITQLSFWPDVEKVIHTYRDNGECPLEGALTIDWTKASPEDVNRLSTIKSHVEAIERQIDALIARNNLSSKLEVRRDNNRLYICPIDER